MAVLLTDAAAREIKSIVGTEKLDAGKVCLRVGVRGGGCSGFSYLLDLTETQKDADEAWDYSFELAGEPAADKANGNEGGNSNGGSDGGSDGKSNGDGETTHTFKLKVICDPKSYLYLNGTTVGFKDELMGRGFVFENPNASSSCGCGSSFSV